MLNIHARCDLWGKEFSPKAVERQLGNVFRKQNEPGDISHYGRYMNQPLPYGSATVVLRDGGERGEMIPRKALRWIAKNLELFKQAGATDIDIDVVVAYGGDCSLGMSPGLLKDLAALGIGLSISCYEDEELVQDWNEVTED
jgi:hypothetical protein